MRPDEFADLDRILEEDEEDELDVDVDQLIDDRLEESWASRRDEDEDDEDDLSEESGMRDMTDDDDDDLDEEDDIDDAPAIPSRQAPTGLSEDALRTRSREEGRKEIEACRARCAARRAS
ncbi:MAG: hypothetical protein QM820_47020 [Minicystis sp.]